MTRHVKLTCLGYARLFSMSRYVPTDFDKKWIDVITASNLEMPGEGTKFSMIFPPPNVTGNLHLGHAYTSALQDAIARYQRMRGCPIEWIAGTDHAGIAAELVVRRNRILSQRPEECNLVEEIEKTTSEFQSNIRNQLKTFGVLLDWKHEYYTKSPQFSQLVNDSFIALMDKGLVYRQEKFINWCPRIQTAIADVEVEHETVVQETVIDLPGCNQVPFGAMYKLHFGKGVCVWTTRPETSFGDVALCVNPADGRYRNLVGKSFKHPVTKKQLPLLADDSVDMSVGSGILKLTPSVSPTDFEIAIRNGITEFPNFLTDSGFIDYPELPRYHGKHRFLVKQQLIEDFSLQSTPHAQTIPRCTRTGDVIEHLLKPQWFFKSTAFREQLLNLDQLQLEIFPLVYRKMWRQWTEKLEDWCISRQISWGHSIPIYYFPSSDKKEIAIAAGSHQEAVKKAQAIDSSITDSTPIKQENDVLDTWFSSALIPAFLSPTSHSLVVTGHDILFFWIMRMVLMSLALNRPIPFRTVFLHPLLKNSLGKKMSKSDGISIDPMQILLPGETSNNMDSGAGIDALRLSLLGHSTNELFITYDPRRTKLAAQFGNKLLNVLQFISSNEQQILYESPDSIGHLSVRDSFDSQQLTPFEIYLSVRYNQMLTLYKEGFEQFELFKALQAMQRFILDELCGVHIDYCKTVFYSRQTDGTTKALRLCYLRWIFSKVLALLAPFAPVLPQEICTQLQTVSLLHASNVLHPIDLPEHAINTASQVEFFYKAVANNYQPSMHRTTLMGTKSEAEAFIQQHYSTFVMLQKRRPKTAAHMSESE